MESSRSGYCSRHLFLSGLCVVLIGLFICFSGMPGYAATYTVTNNGDSGAGSLRQAIIDANVNPGADEITFGDFTGTIVLTTSQLEISSSMTIQGPGAEQLAISGNDTCRVFFINTAESVDISGVSIVSGRQNAGGGIYNMSGNLTVTDCIFSSNTATIDGGGMYNEDCHPIVTNCIFSLNTAGNDGGGMYNYWGSSPTVTNCTFSNNSATYSGGGMYNYDSANPAVINCTFTSNIAYNGGGMFNEFNSNPTVTNCTFASNTSYSGAGIYNVDNSSPTVTNCTFTSNIATIGGGISNNNGSNPIVVNCIFWDDCDFDEIYNANESSVATLSYCIVQSDDYGTGTIILGNVTSADPLIEALADNGGPTQTCALPAGSPAIDTGTEDGAPLSDQRGVSRPQGSGIDMGAFELEQAGDDDDDDNTDDENDNDNDEESANSDSGGCHIATMPMLGLLLMVPVMFLTKKN